MELILWRHAEAEDGDDDLARALTPKGRRQAQQMAQWLKGQFTGPVRVVSSPAVRTRETADALAMPYEIDQHIAPDASADQLLAASGWPDGHGLEGESALWLISIAREPPCSCAAQDNGGLFRPRQTGSQYADGGIMPD